MRPPMAVGDKILVYCTVAHFPEKSEILLKIDYFLGLCIIGPCRKIEWKHPSPPITGQTAARSVKCLDFLAKKPKCSSLPVAYANGRLSYIGCLTLLETLEMYWKFTKSPENFLV